MNEAADVAPTEFALGPDQRDLLLATLLRRYPSAIVTAIDANGRLVDLPPSLELTDHRTVAAHSALDVIAPASRPAVFANLDLAKVRGAAVVRVELVTSVEALCHLVDVRHRHGVLVGMIASESAVDLASSLADRPAVIPRSGRMDKDDVAMIRFVDDRLCRMLGYEFGELVGRRSLELVHPDDQPRAINAWIELLGSPGGSSRLRLRHRRRDGAWIWIEVTNTNQLDRPGGCVVAELIDVSDEMDVLEQLRQREELLTSLAEALPSGVLRLGRDRTVVYSNARLHEIVGVAPAATFDQQLATVVADDRPVLDRALTTLFDRGCNTDLEVRLQKPGESAQRRCAVAMRVLTDGHGSSVGALVCIDDVTEASALRAELERRATVDALTGCLNRAAVLDVLDDRLGSHRGGAAGTTVVYLDLDGFKRVNDTFGHHAGDRLLATTAARIRDAVRAGDVVGRLGGDEFIVVASALASPNEADELATRIRVALAEPVDLGGGRWTKLRVSIGVAWSAGPDVTATDLTTAADRAMYRSKRSGGGAPVSVLS